MEEPLDIFTKYLPDNAVILDLGCGSGRDSLNFIESGYDVTAIDGAEELCKLASIHIGQDVLQMKFTELNFNEVFDGIWASASLLHCTLDELDDILKRIIHCLKPGGILYMSFNYGENAGVKNDLYYTEFNTRKMKELISQYSELRMTDIWKSHDVLDVKGEDFMLNVLVKRISVN